MNDNGTKTSHAPTSNRFARALLPAAAGVVSVAIVLGVYVDGADARGTARADEVAESPQRDARWTHVARALRLNVSTIDDPALRRRLVEAKSELVEAIVLRGGADLVLAAMTSPLARKLTLHLRRAEIEERTRYGREHLGWSEDFAAGARERMTTTLLHQLSRMRATEAGLPVERTRELRRLRPTQLLELLGRAGALEGLPSALARVSDEHLPARLRADLASMVERARAIESIAAGQRPAAVSLLASP